jgi:peptidoglycan/LPS O-acetylase OafA/YrhL
MGVKGAENQRIRHIDGLRGLAVLSVVIYHAWLSYPVMRQNHWANYVFNAGRHGVDLFFVLSGFCLSYPTLLSLHTRGSASFDVIKYGAHRLVRIIPPYYAAIAFSAVIVGLAIPHRVAPFSSTDILRQALFLDRGTRLVNGPFWTLALEMRWYFIFPVALLVWVRYPRMLGVAMLALLVMWTTRAANEDVLFLPGFLLGIVSADICVRGTRFGMFALIGAVLFGILAVAIDPGTYGKGTAGAQGFNPLWMPAAFCLVVGASSVSLLRRMFTMRWLIVLGVTSYSIYLTHFPVITLMAQRTNATPILAVLCALAVGFAFWVLVERPFVYTPLRGRAISATQAELSTIARRFGMERWSLPFVHRHTGREELEAIA